MRTLTYQEMMFVGGGKEDAQERPPKAEQSSDPTQDDVIGFRELRSGYVGCQKSS